MPDSKTARTKVFISYSHKDAKWLKRLQVHLKPLEREGIVERWDDTRITPGNRWKDDIKQAIDEAKVAVLLISPDFLASDFIADDELPPLLAAAEKEGLVILPVILSPSRFKHIESLSQFQAVNDSSKPLVDLKRGDRGRVWVKLTEHIEKALKPAGSPKKTFSRDSQEIEHTEPYGATVSSSSPGATPPSSHESPSGEPSSIPKGQEQQHVEGTTHGAVRGPEKDDTDRVKQFTTKIKSHRFFSVFIIIGKIIIALGGVASALVILYSIFPPIFQSDSEFVIQGDLFIQGEAETPQNIVVKVIWLIRAEEEGRLKTVQSPEVSVIDPLSGRISYALALKDPPGNEVLNAVNGARLGMGVIVGFHDVEKNGMLKEGQIVAVARQHFIRYIAGDWQPELSDSEEAKAERRLFRQIPHGFSVVETDSLEVNPDDWPFLSSTDTVNTESPVTINLLISEDSNMFFEALNKTTPRPDTSSSRVARDDQGQTGEDETVGIKYPLTIRAPQGARIFVDSTLVGHAVELAEGVYTICVETDSLMGQKVQQVRSTGLNFANFSDHDMRQKAQQSCAQ